MGTNTDTDGDKDMDMYLDMDTENPYASPSWNWLSIEAPPPPSRDRTFLCGPHRRSDFPLCLPPHPPEIRLSAVVPPQRIVLSAEAPPEWLDIPLLPFPPCGINCHTTDRLNIYWGSTVALGIIHGKCVYGGTNILSKPNLPEGRPHCGIGSEFAYLSKFKFIFKTALWYEPGGWAHVLM